MPPDDDASSVENTSSVENGADVITDKRREDSTTEPLLLADKIKLTLPDIHDVKKLNRGTLTLTLHPSPLALYPLPFTLNPNPGGGGGADILRQQTVDEAAPHSPPPDKDGRVMGEEEEDHRKQQQQQQQQEEETTTTEMNNNNSILLIEEVVVVVSKEHQEKLDDSKIVEASFVHANYASKDAGAVILAQSPEYKGSASNLLVSDKDKYALIPCGVTPKIVVIGLSEDILPNRIALSNFETYSSYVKSFQVLGRLCIYIYFFPIFLYRVIYCFLSFFTGYILCLAIFLLKPQASGGQLGVVAQHHGQKRAGHRASLRHFRGQPRVGAVP
jgi:hypothetical protein